MRCLIKETTGQSMRISEADKVNCIAEGLRKGFAATAREPLPERIKELARRLAKKDSAAAEQGTKPPPQPRH
jgi:hypothetical protein